MPVISTCVGFMRARMGEGRGVHRVLVGKPEGKKPLGRPRRRWDYNIKMDLQEVGEGCGDCNELSGSINAGNFLTSCKTS
jgi:hypothetical protein